MIIEGIFQRADEENNNKRIYTEAILKREMKKLETAVTERRLMGELDHPSHDSVKLNNVSHLVTSLRMEGKEIIGRAEILNTPAGKVAQALIEGGVKVGISSRGLGTLSEGSDGKRYVNEDFQLITWDLVADPSTRGAFPGLTESTQIQSIIDDVLPEAEKVKNFATLLRTKLEEGTVKATNKAQKRAALVQKTQAQGPMRFAKKDTPREKAAGQTAAAHGQHPTHARDVASARQRGDEEIRKDLVAAMREGLNETGPVKTTNKAQRRDYDKMVGLLQTKSTSRQKTAQKHGGSGASYVAKGREVQQTTTDEAMSTTPRKSPEEHGGSDKAAVEIRRKRLEYVGREVYKRAQARKRGSN